jgi:hypothetical protein
MSGKFEILNSKTGLHVNWENSKLKIPNSRHLRLYLHSGFNPEFEFLL